MTTLGAAHKMLRTTGEAESTADHRGRRTGARRPRYMALDWENRHVRVRLERPLHQAWVKLRESGGFQDDSSFSSGAPGRCRPGLGAGAGCGTGSSFSYITAVLGSIWNTQCACAIRWIVPLILGKSIGPAAARPARPIPVPLDYIGTKTNLTLTTALILAVHDASHKRLSSFQIPHFVHELG